MFDVFGSVKQLCKLDEICVDNNIFRLHYKATVIFLVTSSLLVTSRQYIGDPIDCIVEGEVHQVYPMLGFTETLTKMYNIRRVDLLIFFFSVSSVVCDFFFLSVIVFFPLPKCLTCSAP